MEESYKTDTIDIQPKRKWMGTQRWSYHIKWYDGDQLPHSICDMLQNDEEADDVDDDTEVTNVYDSDDSEESDDECL